MYFQNQKTGDWGWTACPHEQFNILNSRPGQDEWTLAKEMDAVIERLSDRFLDINSEVEEMEARPVEKRDPIFQAYLNAQKAQLHRIEEMDAELAHLQNTENWDDRDAREYRNILEYLRLQYD